MRRTEAVSSNDSTKLIFGGLVVIVVMTVISFVVGYALATQVAKRSQNVASNALSSDWFSNREKETGDLNLYWKVYDILRQQYVDESKLDKNKLYYGSIQGMVNSIEDPATAFFTPEETTSYEQGQAGEYEGVGMELGARDGSVMVVSPFEGSPAKAAGIQSGDRIVKVDTTDVRGKNVYEVVKLIRGKAATEVTITVARTVNSSVQTKEFKITRSKITSPSMRVEEISADGVARVNVYRYTDSTLREWQENWDKVVAELQAKNAKGVIIDLRGNPGGYLQGAVYMAEDFLPKGKVIVYQESRLQEYRAEHVVTRTGRLLEIPVVILVNNGSASASEIFSGALQVHKRATVIGEKTYGKGTAQIIYPFKDDGSSLHLTVSKWLLPNKKWIQASEPIVPDQEVTAKPEEVGTPNDPQTAAALKKIKDMIK